ncbi:PD-(D/E)XK nuclease family protein [Paraburkholderia fungorum]|uniref:PD-(D/E)XK nuclease family protein n=1 Tax=Paraburkholderia fungorum TaxID=134537 RepID=UPI00402B4FB6
MHTLIGLMFFSLAIAVAVWMLIVWRGFTQDWLPEELKTARVALVEKNLWIDADLPRSTGTGFGASRTYVSVPVVGRPDRIYKLSGGQHVPVENKNRDLDRVFDTDIAQLSLQAWLLRQKGFETASFGYVAINNRRTRQRTAHKVDLLDDAACVRIINRYLDVTEGRVEPRKSRGKKCNSCGHRIACHG